MSINLPQGPLASIDWLKQHLGDDRVRVLDASWHMPNAERDAREEFAQKHISGAQFFDIDLISDRSNSLPHMMASPQDFATAVGALGISNDDVVIIYDVHGLFSAARAWWNFKVMGHKNVFVLDGGLAAWTEAGGTVVSAISATTPTTYEPSPVAGAAWSAQNVLANIEAQNAQLVDVRPAERFEGTVAEPRAGVRSGHIPKSKNLPFPSLITNGRLKENSALSEIISAAHVDLTQPITASCGSGVTAPILLLAAAKLGYNHLNMYDGSWAEWGGSADLPIETGK